MLIVNMAEIVMFPATHSNITLESTYGEYEVRCDPNETRLIIVVSASFFIEQNIQVVNFVPANNTLPLVNHEKLLPKNTPHSTASTESSDKNENQNLI